MEIDPIKIIKQINPKFKEEDFIELIESYFITKFGSRKKMELYFKNNNIDPLDEYVKDNNLEVIPKIFSPILKSENMSDLLENLNHLKNKTDKEELIQIINKLKKLDPEVSSILNLSDSRMKISIIPALEKYLKLSLSKAREELGYPDQRTFNKWLKVFFEDKYLNRGKTNGRISLEEYIEIVSEFMLSYNEETFGDATFEELQDRFKNQKNMHRKELKKLTNNNYALLNQHLEEINIDEELNLPENYRKVPYKIATILTKEIKKRI